MKLTQKSTSSKIQEQVSEMQVANKIYVMHMTNYFCKSKSVDTIQQMIIVKYIPSNFGGLLKCTPKKKLGYCVDSF